MSKQTLIVAAALFAASMSVAEEVPIVGNVEARCSVYTTATGVYGNPAPNRLSTAPADGGVIPKVRFDVAQADYYTARVTYPTSFSSSPVLNDSLAWTGSVSVSEVTDPAMADYETNKVEYDNVVEFDLNVAGTTWFEITSTVEYGYNKALPAGEYTSIVVAECIAN